MEDIRQVAALGLVKAAAGYVSGPDRPFHNYAIPTINGELRRHFRDRGWWIRPPRALQEAHAAIRDAEETLSGDLRRAPTDVEIADATGVAAADVRASRSLGNCYSPRSLDSGPNDEAAGPGEKLGALDPGVDAAEWRVCLAEAMDHLSARDRHIIALRFVEERTQTEIGAELGVTQMQVSRLLTRILGDLREALGDQVLVDFREAV